VLPIPRDEFIDCTYFGPVAIEPRLPFRSTMLESIKAVDAGEGVGSMRQIFLHAV
jgi:hypothetical protein